MKPVSEKKIGKQLSNSCPHKLPQIYILETYYILYLVNFQYLCIVCQKCKNMVCVFFSANFRNGCRKRPARHIELRLKKIVQKSRMEKNI